MPVFDVMRTTELDGRDLTWAGAMMLVPALALHRSVRRVRSGAVFTYHRTVCEEGHDGVA